MTVGRFAEGALFAVLVWGAVAVAVTLVVRRRLPGLTGAMLVLAAGVLVLAGLLVGVALGILILGERLSWNEPVGALVVFLGIVLAQNRLHLRRRTPVSEFPATLER